MIALVTPPGGRLSVQRWGRGPTGYKLATPVAPSKRPQLQVEERPERGSRATRRLRREGLVPGVVYGGPQADCTSFKVDARELRRVLLDASAVIDVSLDGKTKPVIVKDQQRHPVRDELVHIDLLEVRLDEKIQTTVGVELHGVEDAPGVKEGGVLEHITRELNVEALPTDIPEEILYDVSELQINDTVTLEAVAAPPGVTLLDNREETVVATLTPPRLQVEEEEEIEEETEVVGEEGAPEGAAAEQQPSEGDEAGESGS